MLQQLQRNNLLPPIRRALTEAFFATIDRRRAGWQKEIASINLGLGALHRSIEKQQKLWEAQPKKFTKKTSRRVSTTRQSEFMCSSIAGRGKSATTGITSPRCKTLRLSPSTFNPSKIIIESVIKKISMGEPNRIRRLQNYVVGLSPEGFVLKPDGSLDLDRSFIRVDYFSFAAWCERSKQRAASISNRPIGNHRYAAVSFSFRRQFE